MNPSSDGNDDARALFLRALPLFESTGAQAGQANTLLNLGQLEATLDNLDPATTHRQKAKHYAIASGSPALPAWVDQLPAIPDLTQPSSQEAPRE